MPAPLEVADPEKFANFLVEYAQNTGESIKALAESCGIPEGSARYIIKRLEGQYQPVVEEAKRVSSARLVEQIEEKLPMLLNGITSKKVDDAPIREIAVAFGVLAEKRQLLKGEPTQILSYEERKNLNELAPALVKELRRRGNAIDVEYSEVPTVNVTPPDVPQETALSKTARLAEKRKNARNKR